MLLMLMCTSSAYAYFPADWMGQIYRSRPDTKLTAVAIPGTHDSATYNISILSRVAPGSPFFYMLGKPLVAGWAKTQFTDVYHQLLSGIRFLDLRVLYRKNKCYVVHGLVSVSLQKVIKQVLRFAIEHPREIVLVWIELTYEIAHRLAPEEVVNVQERAKQEFRDYIGRYHLPFSHQLTFREAWQSGGSIMLMDELQRFWPNTPSAERVQAYINDSFNNRKTQQFNEMQFILTPTSNTELFKALLHVDFGVSNNALSVFSEPLRQVTPQWINEFDSQGKHFNIVSTDFISLFPFAKTVIDLNEKHF